MRNYLFLLLLPILSFAQTQTEYGQFLESLDVKVKKPEQQEREIPQDKDEVTKLKEKMEKERDLLNLRIQNQQNKNNYRDNNPNTYIKNANSIIARLKFEIKNINNIEKVYRFSMIEDEKGNKIAYVDNVLLKNKIDLLKDREKRFIKLKSNLEYIKNIRKVKNKTILEREINEIKNNILNNNNEMLVTHQIDSTTTSGTPVILREKDYLTNTIEVKKINEDTIELGF